MSMPNIPDIAPNISVNRGQVINVLLASIALEELGLAHIINAEGEKIQAVLGGRPSIGDLICINKAVMKTLRDVVKKEILLQYKLDEVIELLHCDSDCPPKKRCDDDY